MNNEPSNSSEQLPPEVFDALYDAAVAEGRAREMGISAVRIAKTVHTPLNKELIRLRLQGIDTRLAFVPEKQESEVKAADDELTPVEEQRVEHLMNTIGISYTVAVDRVRSRRRE